jgi:F0F1-type ATP synthase membrane subunit b/b'
LIYYAAKPFTKGKDGRDKSTKDFIEDACQMSTRLTLFLADNNAKRKAAHELKRVVKGTLSSKVTCSAS